MAGHRRCVGLRLVGELGESGPHERRDSARRAGVAHQQVRERPTEVLIADVGPKSGLLGAELASEAQEATGLRADHTRIFFRGDARQRVE